MNARLRAAVFALACVAQIAVPASLVVKHERTRASGTAWRFQTAPVDPGDPFRGRYVRLSFAAAREPVPMADTGYVYLAPETRVYAELARGPDGYARLVKLHDKRPTDVEYVDVFAQHLEDRDPDKGSFKPAMFVRLPFDRYYLPEDRAPDVERRYREASRTARDKTYAEVRVLEGHAALVSLVLDGEAVR